MVAQTPSPHLLPQNFRRLQPLTTCFMSYLRPLFSSPAVTAAVSLSKCLPEPLQRHLRKTHFTSTSTVPVSYLVSSSAFTSSSSIFPKSNYAAKSLATSSEVVDEEFGDDTESNGEIEFGRDEVENGETSGGDVQTGLGSNGSKLPSLTVKEKKELASYAHSLGKKLKAQSVGKSGVTANVATSFIETLEANELLKLFH